MLQPPIGIDLGTTNSLVSYFENGDPKLVPNSIGEFLTPSVVSFDGRDVLVGQAAKERLATHPSESASVFKRKMGTSSVEKVGGGKYSPEELSAFVLRKLKADAEAHLGCSISDVVVSVPAYFNQTQRMATRAACQIAGLNPTRLVNEPTAAALAYGLQDIDEESQFLVFDLGGGTFDVTILEHFEGVMEVKASSGDAFLGGEDFTEVLAKLIGDRLGATWSSLGKNLQREIRLRAETAKLQLSQAEEYLVNFSEEAGKDDVLITRTAFHDATTSLQKRMIRPIERCFYDLEFDLDNIDRVVLVGGATRMPLIRKLVARHLKKLPETHLNPDHVVALGAAVQAALVAEDRALEDVVMTDVSPFSVGVETAHEVGNNKHLFGFFAPIIERNTPLPASREQEFYTTQNRQTKLDVRVYQGEAPKVIDNILLGNFEIDVPRGKAGEESMVVRITYDTSGLIEVEAHSVSTGRKSSIVITENAGELSKSDVQKSLEKMQKLKLHPRDDEANTALMSRMNRLYHMASREDRSYIQSLILQFEQVLENQDSKEIEVLRGELTQTLNEIDDFYVS